MSGGAKLARMANDVARFFRAYPEAEAISGIRDHLTAFWSPQMRADLAAREAAEPDGGPALDPLVRAALTEPRPAAPSPTERESAGPDEAGALTSDAG